eukprot:1179791-Prorocentrum_minimum.AAC.8
MGSANPQNRFDGFHSANGKARRPFCGSEKIVKRTRRRAFPLAEANPSNLFYGFAEPIWEPISGTFLLTRPAWSSCANTARMLSTPQSVQHMIRTRGAPTPPACDGHKPT